ncbi:MAG: hypothetical protein HRU28_15730, partial [Rhizobiales bacterium]|nr:hypothetical protein [Hyphomicrobiales bacterium]
MVKHPFFKVYIDGSLISTAGVSVNIHDEAGIGSDSVTITIPDPDGIIFKPDIKDKKCKVTIGYVGDIQHTFGEYSLTTRSYSYAPNQWEISGHGADFNEKSKEQFERTLKDITLEDLVAKCAKEMGLKPRVSKIFKSIKYKALSQTNETNISFLTRLADDLGAIAKIGNGYLIFVERGQGKNAAGDDLPL